MSCLVDEMSESCAKCGSVYPKAQGGILKCLVLSTVIEELRNLYIFTITRLA